MKMYEEMQLDEDGEAISEPSHKNDLLNKFKIQSLEEVTERSEESDITSHMSYNSIDLYSSDKSFDTSSDHDINIRIKINEELEQIK